MRPSKIESVLRVCRPTLASAFYSGGLVDKLFSQKCITRNELEDINSEKTSFDKSRCLMNILGNKPDSVLDVVLKALHEDGTQSHLERALYEAAQKYDEESHLPSGTRRAGVRVLPQVWWPARKELIPSFVHRTGKDDQPLVHQLRQQLTTSDGRVTAIVANKQVLVGMGGIGKTTTAKWYAKEYEDKYDHIIWIDSEGESLSIAFSRLAKELKLGESATPLEYLVPQIYGRLQEATCLFIFDNAERFGSLRQWFPTDEAHHALITSRNHDWGHVNEQGRPVSTFQLDVFTPAECVTLLTNTLGPPSVAGKCTNEEEMIALGTELGFLPLALQVAVATILKTTRYTLAVYLTEIRVNLKLLVDRQILNEYERSISATLQLSIQQITNDENIDPQIRETCLTILKVAAYCEPSGIPITLFYGLPSTTSASVSPALVSDALDELVTYSLMSNEEKWYEGAARLFGMHRLLQYVTRVKLLTQSGLTQACETVKVAFGCMELDFTRFIRHAVHAWNTVTACHELDHAILRTCHQFPYTISLTSLVFMDIEPFLDGVLVSLKRVYNDWDLPVVQIKLRLIDALLEGRVHETEARNLRAKRIHAELLQMVENSSHEIPFRHELLWHLRLFGLQLKMRCGDADEECLYLFQKGFDEMKRFGYTGKTDGIKLHHLGLGGISEETSVFSMRLALTLINVCRLVEDCRQPAAGIELLKRELTLEDMDIESICAIQQFMDKLGFYFMRSEKADIIPLLYTLLEANILHKKTYPGFLAFNRMERSTVVTNICFISTQYVHLLQDSKDILGVLTLLMDVSKMIGKHEKVPDDLLVAMKQVIDRVILKPTDNLANSDPVLLTCVLEDVWHCWTGLLTQTLSRGGSIGRLFEQLLPLNSTYTSVLLRVGREAEIPTVDAGIMTILKAAKFDWEQLHPVIGALFAPLNQVNLPATASGEENLLDPTIRKVVESKLSLVLHAFCSANDPALLHNWYDSSLESLLALYDDACYLHLCLGQLDEAVQLWNQVINITGIALISMEHVARIGLRSFRLLETGADSDEQNTDRDAAPFGQTLRAFVCTLAQCVRIPLGLETRFDCGHSRVTQGNLLILIIRLVKCGQHEVARDLISKLSAPFGRSTQIFNALKELGPELERLAADTNSGRFPSDGSLLAKLRGLQQSHAAAEFELNRSQHGPRRTSPFGRIAPYQDVQLFQEHGYAINRPQWVPGCRPRTSASDSLPRHEGRLQRPGYPGFRPETFVHPVNDYYAMPYAEVSMGFNSRGVPRFRSQNVGDLHAHVHQSQTGASSRFRPGVEHARGSTTTSRAQRRGRGSRGRNSS